MITIIILVVLGFHLLPTRENLAAHVAWNTKIIQRFHSQNIVELQKESLESNISQTLKVKSISILCVFSVEMCISFVDIFSFITSNLHF